MSWYIDANINEGYPYNTTFPDHFITGWTHGVNDVYLPYMSWRIAEGINEGYPFIWAAYATLNGWWYDGRPVGSYAGTSESSMTIGGSQSNYPNGFTGSNRGGIKDQFDDTDMSGTQGGGYSGWRDMVNNLMAGKAYLANASELSTVITNLNDTTNIFDSAARQIIQEFYGANVYDGILSCRYFPFDVSYYFWTGGITPASHAIKLFGKYNIGTAYPLTDGSIKTVTIGTLDLDIQQAWEIESIDFSIYLPFAGVFPIDIRGACTIQVDLAIDIFEGAGEYTVYIDGAVAGKYRCILACDVPLNFTQGQMKSNLFSNIASIAGQGLKLAGGVIGAAVGGVPGAIVGSSIGSIGSAGSQVFNQHYAVTAQSMGGALNFSGYPYPRILAKIPKMHKDGYGYAEVLGENRSTTYTNLSTVSGFVQCQNYKSDIIVATDDEKREIEQLMNTGVFI